MLSVIWIFMLIAIALLSGSSEEDAALDQRDAPKILEVVIEDASTMNHPESIDTISPRIIAAGLVNVQSINPAIRVDLKYATTDNFMNTNVYGGFRDAYLQPEVAERLGKVQDYLAENHPGYSLLIYDAVRPNSVQQFMWDLLDSIPVHQRTKFVSNPKNGSLHSYGCAVDVTLWKEGSGPVDMGAGYDDMRKIAYPEFERHFLSTGELTSEQYANRQLLRKAMRQGGFWVIQTEWWHFNAHSRETSKKMYEVVE